MAVEGFPSQRGVKPVAATHALLERSSRHCESALGTFQQMSP